MTAAREDALLVLADGTTFEGEAVGAAPPGGIATGPSGGVWFTETGTGKVGALRPA